MMEKYRFNMKPEQQRIAIAEACGWKNLRIERLAGGSHVLGKCPRDYTSSHGFASPPDYLNDLNAMHEAENLLINTENFEEYQSHLAWCDHGKYPEWRATAAQRAEAFLKTLNLWKD
jgi:hypothetical protein